MKSLEIVRKTVQSMYSEIPMQGVVLTDLECKLRKPILVGKIIADPLSTDFRNRYFRSDLLVLDKPASVDCWGKHLGSLERRLYSEVRYNSDNHREKTVIVPVSSIGEQMSGLVAFARYKISVKPAWIDKLPAHKRKQNLNSSSNFFRDQRLEIPMKLDKQYFRIVAEARDDDLAKIDLNERVCQAFKAVSSKVSCNIKMQDKNLLLMDLAITPKPFICREMIGKRQAMDAVQMISSLQACNLFPLKDKREGSIAVDCYRLDVFDCVARKILSFERPYKCNQDDLNYFLQHSSGKNKR